MEDKINTAVTAALVDHLKIVGTDLDLFAEISDFPLDELVRGGHFIPNEGFIILFANARQTLDDPLVARKVGKRTANDMFGDRLERAVSLLPAAHSIGRQLMHSLRKLFPMLAVTVEPVSPTGLEIEISRKGQTLHTNDHCRFIQGFIEGVVELAGGVVEEVREDQCMITIDRAGEIEGSLYRLDDEGQVWCHEACKIEDDAPETLAARPGDENYQTAGGTAYGRGNCRYRVSFTDPRNFAQKVWAKSGGRVAHLAGLLFTLEKKRSIDPDSYQQITSEWRRWLAWEPSYRLTKAKYIFYLGILVLAMLPMLGHYYEDMGGELGGMFLSMALSLLILALGFMIIKMQLDHARKIHKKHEDSQKFLQHAGVGVTIVNPDYTIEYANPLIQEVHGQVTGLKCFEAFHWENKPCLSCPFQEVLAGSFHAQDEIEVLNKDGQTRWYHLTATPIMGGNERITSVINVTTDITERVRLADELSKKRAELGASEARYRSFMANAADAIIITDPAHIIIEANKKALALLGFDDPESLAGRSLFESDLLINGETDKVRDLFEAMIGDLMPRAFDSRVRGAGGTMLEVEARAIPILKNSEVCWVQCIVRDVTERKQQEFEKALLLSISNAIKDAPDLEAMITQALEGISAVMAVPIAAIFLREPGHNHLRLAAQLGMSPHAIKSLATLAADGSAHDVASRAAILKRPIVIGDMEAIKSTVATRNRIRRMGIKSLASIPMLMDENIQGIIYIASRDHNYFNPRRLEVINQVANELAVGVSKQRLHHVIREKNRELVLKNKELENAAIQLLQSEKMASIGQLAAGVAHEINNPMGYINSNLNLLREYRADLIELIALYQELEQIVARGSMLEEGESIMHRIKTFKERVDIKDLMDDIRDMINESIEGSDRVTHIVQGLKEFSHPSVSAPQLADIHQALDSTLNIVWNELKYKAELTREYGDLPQISCCLQELKQVFMNILVNASQAIENKGRITIRTFVQGGFACIQIQDTGAGMTSEQMKKIFDPFFTTKDVGKGTGLGLSISYSIIQKHRGSIEVESAPGQGSTFTIRLPLEGVYEQPAGPGQEAAQQPEVENEHDGLHLQ